MSPNDVRPLPFTLLPLTCQPGSNLTTLSFRISTPTSCSWWSVWSRYRTAPTRRSLFCSTAASWRFSPRNRQYRRCNRTTGAWPSPQLKVHTHPAARSPHSNTTPMKVAGLALSLLLRTNLMIKRSQKSCWLLYASTLLKISPPVNVWAYWG